jgi:hypothetical protein
MKGELVNTGLELEILIPPVGDDLGRQLALFALINLGVVESLSNGLLGATDAVRVFFNAENCLYVRKRLKEKTANRIMSHGVQLPDLFDCLPEEEAQREFPHELATMRNLCFKILEKDRLVKRPSVAADSPGLGR